MSLSKRPSVWKGQEEEDEKKITGMTTVVQGQEKFITGDIVIVADSTAPRGSWLLGKVGRPFLTHEDL